MKTITLFANKGGSGRTVSTMALASGFLTQGRRVSVMDCSDLAGCEASPLRAWREQMATCKFHRGQLDLVECQGREEVEDNAAAAKAQGIEVLLVDTSARIFEPQLVALDMADLIIAPAIGPLEAKRISDSVAKYLDTPKQLYGLVIGSHNRLPPAGKTRKAFGFHPVFKSELPWAEALSEQVLNGDIAQFVASLACKPDEPGFARFRAAQEAWTAVQRLTFEVDWALTGQRLEQYAIDQPHFRYEKEAVA
ncbi:hypothetical protein [Phaeobacter inhibens]|uniref:hypothetical protein n=1 Tax=Phaeobacter inhibens TaxID=221822 RepID=UPI000C9CC327|nr:hypothetical protein [Phaeobacter inhibens]AUQ63193.1 putative crown gall tumor protein VirC1 [Phaeobacter inhibens]AUQ83097.1 putative crown gall tumor protein VirC1 [Phaeobacter inhibens]AUQ90858.1 putative crown gall tumor protein VirC1 [Phaeobacter inhibens]MDO6757610.1 hypothetical protein [Phaeobacter inhibens]